MIRQLLAALLFFAPCQGCDSGNGGAPSCPTENYVDLDGTFIADYSVTDGDGNEESYPDHELVIDQDGQAVNFWGILGVATDTQILINTAQTKTTWWGAVRYVYYEGVADREAATLNVQVEDTYGDGSTEVFYLNWTITIKDRKF